MGDEEFCSCIFQSHGNRYMEIRSTRILTEVVDKTGHSYPILSTTLVKILIGTAISEIQEFVINRLVKNTPTTPLAGIRWPNPRLLIPLSPKVRLTQPWEKNFDRNWNNRNSRISNLPFSQERAVDRIPVTDSTKTCFVNGDCSFMSTNSSKTAIDQNKRGDNSRWSNLPSPNALSPKLSTCIFWSKGNRQTEIRSTT